MNIMKRVWNWVKTKMEVLLEKLSGLLTPVMSIIVVLVFVIALVSCACYIELVTKQYRFLLPFNLLNLFHVWSDQKITAKFIEENYTQLLESLDMVVNVFVAVSGLLLCVFSAYSYFKKVVKFNRSSSFQKKKVLQDGKEDVDEMLTKFRGADYIAIFSSTFNWVNGNSDMKSLLTEAAKKKELVLYTKDSAIVSNNLKGQEVLLSALHETKIEGLLHLSYVERNNARYIIYRQEVDETAYIITVKENPESRYLIEIISKLVKAAV